MSAASCEVYIGLSRPIRAKNDGGGRSLLREILGQTDRVGAKSKYFCSAVLSTLAELHSTDCTATSLTHKMEQDKAQHACVST